MVSVALCRWVATSVLDILRNGGVPNDLTPGDVADDAVAREIRAQVVPSNIETARTLVAREDGRMCGAMLARNFPEDSALVARSARNSLDVLV